jgi:hypothetical protein
MLTMMFIIRELLPSQCSSSTLLQLLQMRITDHEVVAGNVCRAEHRTRTGPIGLTTLLPDATTMPQSHNLVLLIGLVLAPAAYAW